MTTLPGSQRVSHFQNKSEHEQEKQRVPKAHVCVILHDFVAAVIFKGPFDLPCSTGNLPAGSWAKEPLWTLVFITPHSA